MKKIKYRPYGFKATYEWNTFKYIGKDYYPIGIFKIQYYFRKRKNKNEKQYKVCNKYSDWERHVKKTLPTYIENYEDFFHWLLEQLEDSESFYENVKTVLIPIYVAIIPFLYTNQSCFLSEFSLLIEKLIFLFTVCVIVVVSVHILSSRRKKINFWKKYIDIAIENYSHCKK